MEQSLGRHPPFIFYMLGRIGSSLAYQMGAVAVGWQIYALTHRALDLGLVGLVSFLPTAVLTFIAGHAADRYDRNRVTQLCSLAEAVVAAFLAAGSFGRWLTVPEIFAALTVFGAVRAFESPASSALLPGVVPERLLQRATALASGVFQLGAIAGPALGGFAYAVSPGVPYAIMAGFWLLGAIALGFIRLDRPVAAKEPPTLASLFAGVGFVRRNPNILGTISLDLFAVLLGGATALLPIYAHDILHTGPWGLGLLRGAADDRRAADHLGARPPRNHAARRHADVSGGDRVRRRDHGVRAFPFGLAVAVRAGDHGRRGHGQRGDPSVAGAARNTDDMRGRVNAVNFLFINASNQLGEFESGVTAALFGAVPAALLGGLGTVAVALLWMKLFPSLRKAERLE